MLLYAMLLSHVRFGIEHVNVSLTWEVSVSLCQVLQHYLSGLSFSSSTLSRDDDALILIVSEHVLVRILCYHEQVRFRFCLCVYSWFHEVWVFPVVSCYKGSEDLQFLERVHWYQNRSSNWCEYLSFPMSLSNSVQ